MLRNYLMGVSGNMNTFLRSKNFSNVLDKKSFNFFCKDINAEIFIVSV